MNPVRRGAGLDPRHGVRGAHGDTVDEFSILGQEYRQDKHSFRLPVPVHIEHVLEEGNRFVPGVHTGEAVEDNANLRVGQGSANLREHDVQGFRAVRVGCGLRVVRVVVRAQRNHNNVRVREGEPVQVVPHVKDVVIEHKRGIVRTSGHAQERVVTPTGGVVGRTSAQGQVGSLVRHGVNSPGAVLVHVGFLVRVVGEAPAGASFGPKPTHLLVGCDVCRSHARFCQLCVHCRNGPLVGQRIPDDHHFRACGLVGRGGVERHRALPDVGIVRVLLPGPNRTGSGQTVAVQFHLTFNKTHERARARRVVTGKCDFVLREVPGLSQPAPEDGQRTALDQVEGAGDHEAQSLGCPDFQCAFNRGQASFGSGQAVILGLGAVGVEVSPIHGQHLPFTQGSSVAGDVEGGRAARLRGDFDQSEVEGLIGAADLPHGVVAAEV